MIFNTLYRGAVVRQAQALGFGAARGLPAFCLYSLLIGYAATARAGALHDAVKVGDRPAIEALLTGGTDIEESDFVVGTALHVAVAQGDAAVAALLLDHGANIEAESELQGARALHLAADFGDLAMITLLLDFDAEIDSRAGNTRTPLIRAAAAGHLEAVALLLGYGAAIDEHENVIGRTALHLAAFHGHVEVVKLLVEGGAKVDARDNRGYTPFILAASTKCTGTWAMLGLSSTSWLKELT